MIKYHSTSPNINEQNIDHTLKITSYYHVINLDLGLGLIVGSGSRLGFRLASRF